MSISNAAERMRAEIEAGLAYVPPHLQGGLARYLFDRVLPGDFLRAVLRNDLAEAAGRMNPPSFAHLRALVVFLQTFAPATSWGSAEAVQAWAGAGDRESEL